RSPRHRRRCRRPLHAPPGGIARKSADDVVVIPARRIAPMTQLLQQALSEVQKLPETEQDAIAALILEELADERRWQERFSRSQDQLARMAAKAREDIQASRVRSGGFDQL